MSQLRYIPTFIGCFVLAGAVMTFIQFASPNLAGFDGYYHIKMARLTLEQGVPLDFPYLPLTIIDSARFLDMHMLFHILQAPFTLLGDLRLAAKWSTVAFAAAAFALTAVVLKRHGVRFPWLWVLLMFAVSSGFLYRIDLPRAQIFGLIFMLLAFHCIIERKPVWLALVAFLFVWTYKGFPILVPLTVFGIFAHYIAHKKIAYNLGLALVVGIAAGLVINPYFPNNIEFLWGDLVLKIFSEDYAANVGDEWYTYDTWELVENTFGALILYVGGLALTDRREWRGDPARIFWFLTATMWLVMMLRSKRFIEYFPPCALIFFAFSARAWLRDLSPAGLSRAATRVSVFGFAGVASWAIYYNLGWARDDMLYEPDVKAYQGGATWLANNTEKGSRVFHTDWDDFPMLFYYNSHNTYIVGLDPDYMRIRDEDLYELWSDISVGEVPDPEDLILETFGSEYVFTDLEHSEFVELAELSERMTRVFADDYTHVYRVHRESAQQSDP